MIASLTGHIIYVEPLTPHSQDSCIRSWNCCVGRPIILSTTNEYAMCCSLEGLQAMVGCCVRYE